MNTIKFFGFFFLISSCLFAQPDFDEETESSVEMRNDSAVVDLREFDAVTLEELKADPALDYGAGPAAMSFWERFKLWLSELFGYLFETGASANWVEILMYVIIIIILGYTLLWLLRIDAVKMLFSNTSVAPIKSVVVEENIHEVDFEKRIAEALAKQEYREATRLLFLHALKILADKQLIHWEPGKTNHDYMNELTYEKLKPGFNDLNYFFENAWYGHFEISESVFTKAQHTFSNWKAQTP